MQQRLRRWRLGQGLAFFLAASIVPAQAPNPVTLPDRTSRKLAPQELRAYVNARSVIDLPAAELIKAYPELRGLNFATSQEDLAAILQKVGDKIEAFFQVLPNTSSVEQVTQRKMSLRNERWVESSQKCLYLISARVEKQVRLEEFRTAPDGKPIDTRRMSDFSALSTGFVTQASLFHPLQQPGSAYRLLGTQGKPPKALVIAFAQRPEASDMWGMFRFYEWSGLSSDPIVEWSGAILLQGLAWIDPADYEITRMHTALLAPRNDVGLSALTSEIEYEEVRLASVPHPLRLPREVKVTSKWKDWTYINRHRYSDFKLFSVDTRDGDKKIVIPK